MNLVKPKRLIHITNAVVLILFINLLIGSGLSVKAQTDCEIKNLVKSLSNNTLKVETKATPYKVVGDFNGDKVDDVAIIVKLADTVENIKKKVNVENPYAFAWGNEINGDLLALFVIHGSGEGWQSAQESSVLMLGRNSVLIFQKKRLDETADGMKIVKDENGTISIMFPTEASEGILKWDGKKYVWTETQP